MGQKEKQIIHFERLYEEYAETGSTYSLEEFLGKDKFGWTYWNGNKFIGRKIDYSKENYVYRQANWYWKKFIHHWKYDVEDLIQEFYYLAWKVIYEEKDKQNNVYVLLKIDRSFRSKAIDVAREIYVHKYNPKTKKKELVYDKAGRPKYRKKYAEIPFSTYEKKKGEDEATPTPDQRKLEKHNNSEDPTVVNVEETVVNKLFVKELKVAFSKMLNDNDMFTQKELDILNSFYEMLQQGEPPSYRTVGEKLNIKKSTVGDVMKKVRTKIMDSGYAEKLDVEHINKGGTSYELQSKRIA